MRRIYGLESELGAVIRKKTGEWEPMGAPDSNKLFNELQKLLIFGCEFQENGGRIYLERSGNHLEICSPEASSARDSVLAVRGMEKLVEEAAAAVNQASGTDTEIFFYKDNIAASSSPKESVVSYGSHENYLVVDPCGRIYLLPTQARSSDFDIFDEKFVRSMAVFLMSRIILCGSGYFSDRAPDRGKFLLSPRAEFLTLLLGSGSTSSARPLITTKANEHLCNLPYFFRLHLSCGDPNMSEIAEFLKFSLTGLFLRLTEDGIDFSDLCYKDLYNWREDLHSISRDLTFKNSFIRLADRKTIRPIDVLRKVIDKIKANYPKPDDPKDVAQEIILTVSLAESLLDKLESDPYSAWRELDWAAKLKISQKYLGKYGIAPEELPDFLKKEDSSRVPEIFWGLKMLECKYHELSADGIYRQLAKAGAMRRLVTDKEIELAKVYPPGFCNPSARNRSWLRGEIVWWRKVSGNPHFYLDWNQISNGRSVVVNLPDPFLWNAEYFEQLAGVPRHRPEPVC